ncbi:hypothetical protein [Catellatospora sichuanensis]|uniref:hypothetical protein n=1 Tax=Catellatospora sichuanensis TaxID=1969805 RepID=UPI001642470F|nr:hypothetical protein [Catellatospora sichuanensis]
MADAGSTRTVRCSDKPSQITITITSKRDATLKVRMERDPKAPEVAFDYNVWMK